MNDDQYRQHCQQRFAQFSNTLMTRTNALADTDSLRELALAFDTMAGQVDDLYTEGPTLVTRLFETYPDFAPTFPRELLWFLGGDCLHFMPDEEIAIFQQLEELRDAAVTRGELLDFAAARAKLMNSQ